MDFLLECVFLSRINNKYMLNNDSSAVCMLSFNLLIAVGQVTASGRSKVPFDSISGLISFVSPAVPSVSFSSQAVFSYNLPGENKRSPSPAHTPMQPALLEGLSEGTLHSSEWRKATTWLESR